MQKKVIALAVAGLVSGVAFAQTNVQIYGAADASFDYVQAKDATNKANNVLSHTRVNSNSSIIGFRGSEDLGGGLKAIFQFETGPSLDQRGSQMTLSRDSFVGLNGGFGEVKAGIITGPARSVGAAVDMTVGATGIGANTGMLGKLGGNGGAPASFWDTRRSNSVQYTSPKFGGFEVRAMYGAGERRGQGQKAGSTYELGGIYNNGPIYAALTYGQTKPKTGGLTDADGLWGLASANNYGGTLNPNTGLYPNSGGLTTNSAKLENIRLAGKYTFTGGHQVSALFEQNKASGLDGSVLGALLTPGKSSTSSYTYGIAGKFKVSQPGAIIAQVYQVSKLKNATGANDYKANFIALGYEHALSKRTVLKAYYSRITNKDNARYNYTIGTVNGAAAGSNPTGFSVGVRHSF